MAGTGNQELDAAVAETEKEIFAFGTDATDEGETDDNADTSLEQMEGDDPTNLEEGDDAEDGDDDADGEDGDAEGDGTEKPDGDKSEGDKAAEQNRDKETGQFKAKDDKSGAEKGEGDKGRKGDPSVPLRAEREKNRTLQSDLEKERNERAAERTELETLRTNLAKLEGRLDQVSRGQPAKTEDASKVEDQEPDIFTHPDEWKAWNRKETDKRLEAVRRSGENRFINASLADAHEAHGEKFDAAFAALNKLDPQNASHRAIVADIRNAPNPGKRLMKWHGDQQALQEMGSDPQAFINRKVAEALAEKVKDPEFLKSIGATGAQRSREEGGNDGNSRPRNVIRNPRSLNSEGGRAQRANDAVDNDGSDAAIFKYATS